MFSEPVISLKGLAKCYQIYDNPRARLFQFLFRGKRKYFREFWALRNLYLDILPGEVVGVVGNNGAGKSTLLQLVCGTLAPTCGEVLVKGRVAALLELGAGFNPEFSGRENAYLSAAVSGMSKAVIHDRMDDIIDFSGIRDFIDQPVKTYSSGMYVRLAFSVAINVDPDILVIDEALSVGDGDFSRRSFDKIMALKAQGKTILFCSHSLYQIDAICNRAVWLDNGEIRLAGTPGKVIEAYSDFLSSPAHDVSMNPEEPSSGILVTPGVSRIKDVSLSADGQISKNAEIMSGVSDIKVSVRFTSDPQRPAPSVGICFVGNDGRGVTSAGTHVDGYLPPRQVDGSGEATVLFPKFALLRGTYRLDVYLFCESGIHVYDSALTAAEINVNQDTVEVGVVTLPHSWESEHVG